MDSMLSVRNAFAGGADRLELCSALSEGGLTPSLGFLKAARKATSPDFPIFTMIRPRGGNFVYGEDEIEIMLEDIRNLKQGGANGFVFGLLTSDNEIDEKNCKRLLKEAEPLPATFHRAFDELAEEGQLGGVEVLIGLGFARVLTSGGASTAEEGLAIISRLVERAGVRLSVMPGAGVVPGNVKTILRGTGAKEFHGSARAVGGPKSGDELVVTCEAVVRQMKEIASQP